MSLEATLEKTNELLSQILSALNTAAAAPAELGQPEVKVTRTRKAKTETETAAESKPAPAVEQVSSVAQTPADLVEGDPVGTVYWVIDKHLTVYAQRPGDPGVNISEARVTTAAEYLEKKAVFEKKKQEFLKKPEPATEPAANPAPATQVASPACSQPSEQTQGEVTFAKVVEKMQALHKSAEPGHGREGVLAVLSKWLPNSDKPTVTMLQPLNQNAAILADIEGILTPKVEEEFDPLL